ncbi:testis expressed sequence 2 protein [Echinococcus multilocularis]|uniref:Testis expressed sequence 2 protein n=1 Tax=Echinococcus multilocularis TaxID=6211 RepID=A0A068Y6L3_ECHMU|nr:testis expressed sequence 2 protein [Echinococcus multilocularis]
MSSRRLADLMHRKQEEFDDVLNSLTFSSTAENDIGGLDAALQRFAEQKAEASMKRRGPIQGIPDDDPEPIQFELAEDIVASTENFFYDADSPCILPSSTPSHINAEEFVLQSRRKHSLGVEVPSPLRACSRQQNGGHNAEPPTSTGFRDLRLRRWRHRRRTVSLTESSGEAHSFCVSVYLSPVDILTYLQRPFRRSLRNTPDSTAPAASAAVSLPDVRVENGSLHFKCWAPPGLVCSPNPTGLDLGGVNRVVESQSRTHNTTKKPREAEGTRDVLMVPEGERLDNGFEAAEEKQVRWRRKEPQKDSTVSAVSHEVEGVSSTLRDAETASMAPTILSVSEPFGTESPGLTSSQPPPSQPPSKPKRAKRSKPRFSMFRLYMFGGVLVALLSCCWLLSLSPFLWGAVVGSFVTYCVLRLYHLAMAFLYYPSERYRCCFTDASPGATCCSLHNSLLSAWRPPYAGPLVLPQLRDLQAPPVPQLADEDLRSGPSSGPLGECLGYKLDKHNRPVYRAWMNEIVSYSPDTYHINSTHSVFVTLEGTHLRIQRPRKNVPRRAMFNVPVPPSCGVQFIHQRIYDMRKVTVSLLPRGLIEKRLWSKKYPICLTVKNERNAPPVTLEDNSCNVTPSKAVASSQAQPLRSPSTYGFVTMPDHDEALSKASVPSFPDDGSAYSVSASRFLRVSTSPGIVSGNAMMENVASPLQDPPEDFLLVRHSDLDEKIYLFARTCREKEAWFRRLRGASIGKPLLTTTQQAFKQLLTPSTSAMKASASSPSVRTSSSSTDVTTVADSSATVEEGAATASSVGLRHCPPCTSACDSDAELQMAYLRHMAKFMPASWLLRASQALKLNLNYVSCDSQVPWLNALIGRLFWDFLRHELWLKRVQEKIQGKLKKLHLPYFVNELTVTSVDMGTELPVIRNAGKPFLDNQGLWIEAEVVYAGGFTVSLETNINLMRLRDKTWRPNGAVGSKPLPHPPSEFGSAGAAINNNAGSVTTDYPIEGGNADGTGRSMAAFLSDEEDSADSSTDSDRESALTNAFASILPTAVAVGAPSTFPLAAPASPDTKSTDTQRFAFTPEDNNDLQRPKRRLYRIMDKITRSSYFQKAVDSKFVQRGMEYVSNKAINLQLEVSTLHGTLVLNLPPPPSDRLWYGFRGNPNLRFKLKPKFGETLVTIPRFLEILEKKLILEFQRVFVLPNMDDLVMPLLIPEPILRCSQTSEAMTSTTHCDERSFGGSLTSQQEGEAAAL